MREALNTFLHNAEGLGSTSFFLFLLALFIAMGLWSGLANLRLPHLFTDPSAKNLFLGVRMQVTNGLSGAKGEFIGHIINLDVNQATFLSPVFIPKGEKVTMNFTSLPDFPEAPEPYVAEVSSCRVVDGHPSSFTVSVSFASLGAALKSPLFYYVQQLARQRRLAPVS